MTSTKVNHLETPALSNGSLKPHFAIRPMRYSDISICASNTMDAYARDPIALFLNPKSDKYRHDTVRGYRHNLLGCIVNPQNLNLVAYETSKPDCPIGYGTFARVNCSTGHYIQQQGLLRWIVLKMLTWIIGTCISIEKRLWPDRSAADPESLKVFVASGAADRQRYWADHPERVNRWQAQSLIVAPKWQGKGIGRLIMSEVLKKAQEENVIVGLQASPVGEKLYRKLGFELLGDYSYRVGGDTGGGFMIWYPPAQGEDGKSK